MPDVKIPPNHWRQLKQSANCYVPDLIDASTHPDGGFNNAELHRAGNEAGFRGLSAQLIGRIMNLGSVSNDKAEQCLQYYGALRQSKPHLPAIGNEKIVAAFFGIPGLADRMRAAQMDVEALSSTSGVSIEAINHALDQGRVSAGIVNALYMALRTTSTLSSFCSSRPVATFGATSIAKIAPFNMHDLHLPLPDPNPGEWP
jgi:hypothetical protein